MAGAGQDRLVGVPTRRCIVCRRAASKPELVRIAVSGGAVLVDHSATLPGRGAYLCRRQECLDRALRRAGQALTRALRTSPGTVTIDNDRLRADWGAGQTTATVRVGGETA